MATSAIGVPIKNPNRENMILFSHQLWTGVGGTGQWLPIVGDLVIYYEGSSLIFKRCTEVDFTAETYVLVEVSPQSITNPKATIGNVNATLPDNCRIYVDTSVLPNTLRVDATLTFKGSDCDSIRIFRGVNYTADGEVISGYYEDGKLKSTAIPLELASIENSDNKCIYAPVKGVCTKSVDHGELATIICYGDNSEVLGIASANIVITNGVMALDTASKRILDVRIKSPFISPSDDRLLLLPTNLPLDDLSLMVEVVYNNGTKQLTIDGSRIRLDGLRSSGAYDNFYISSIVGQELPLGLFYKVGSDETYIGDDITGNVIYKPYRAITEEVQGAYALKLFVVPVWQDSARGYKLTYYLYEIGRGNVFDVTKNVSMAVNGPAFDPLLFGVVQRLAVVADLSSLSAYYKTKKHVQNFAITLVSPGTTAGDNFYIEYNINNPSFGKDCVATFYYDNVTYWMLDLRCGCSTKDEWLAKLYNLVYPMYEHRSEEKPPLPTHYQVVTSTKSYVVPIDNWVNPLHVDYEVSEGDTIIIKWINRTGSDDLHLAMTSLIAHQA